MIDESVNMNRFSGVRAANPPQRPTKTPSRASALLLPIGALPGLTWACMTAAPGAVLGPVLTTSFGILALAAVRKKRMEQQWQRREGLLRETVEEERRARTEQIAELQQRQRELLQGFHTSSHHMEQATDPDEVMHLAAENLHHTFNFDRVNLLVLNDNCSEVRLAACHGSEHRPEASRPLPFDQRAGVLAHCAQQQEAMLVNDIRDLEPRMRLRKPLAELPQLRSRSFIICPIIVEGNTVALFGVDNKQHRAALDQADLETVQLFASQVSALLGRLALFEKSGLLTHSLRDTFSALSTFREEYLHLNRDLRAATGNASINADRIAAATLASGERVSETTSSTQEISAAASQLAENMNLLAQHLEQASGTSREIAATSREIETLAVQAEETTRETSQEATRGVTEVASTLDGLRRISSALDVGETTLEKLHHIGERIEQLVGAIHDINDRTSLLALNAAIIAAQAGEHGRPFSVVADEIRSLAGETSRSATSIEELVSRLSGTTEAMEEDFRKTRAHVASGLELGNRTSGRLDSILQQAQRAGDMAEHIRSTTREQATGSQHMNQTVNELKDLGQQCLQAIREQVQGTGRIVKAMEGVETETASTTEAADQQRDATRKIEAIATRINDMARSIFLSLGKREAEGRLLAERLEQLGRRD